MILIQLSWELLFYIFHERLYEKLQFRFKCYSKLYFSQCINTNAVIQTNVETHPPYGCNCIIFYYWYPMYLSFEWSLYILTKYSCKDPIQIWKLNISDFSVVVYTNNIKICSKNNYLVFIVNFSMPTTWTV